MTHCVVVTCPSSQQGGVKKSLGVENTLWANTVLASDRCALQVVGPAGGSGLQVGASCRWWALQVGVPCYM